PRCHRVVCCWAGRSAPSWRWRSPRRSHSACAHWCCWRLRRNSRQARTGHTAWSGRGGGALAPGWRGGGQRPGRSLLPPKWQAHQVIEAALAAQGAPRREALLAGMALLDAVDLRALLPRIGQPTLIVAGRNDRVTPPGAAQWLATQLAHATLFEVPRAGHAPM